jgi:hypothetical protein
MFGDGRQFLTLKGYDSTINALKPQLSFNAHIALLPWDVKTQNFCTT